MKLFTKTCLKDLPWLEMAIKTVKRYCAEDVNWIVCIEDEDLPSLKKIAEGGIGIRDKWPESYQIQNGYMRQQWIKMNAHKVIGTGVYWNWDSDVIAMKPFAERDFKNAQGRPILWYSMLNDLIQGGYPAGRKESLKQIFQRPCNYEWMRCMPIPMNGGILKHAATQLEWSRSFDALKSNRMEFSEFNVMGEFAYSNFPNAFEWRNADQDGFTWAGQFQEHGKICCQHWSHGGIPENVRQWVNAL